MVPEAFMTHVEVLIYPAPFVSWLLLVAIVVEGAKYWSLAGGMVMVILEVVVETVKVSAEVEVAASVKPEPEPPLIAVEVVTSPAESTTSVEVPDDGFMAVIIRFCTMVEVGAAEVWAT